MRQPHTRAANDDKTVSTGLSFQRSRLSGNSPPRERSTATRFLSNQRFDYCPADGVHRLERHAAKLSTLIKRTGSL
jgi:hypothetical protein